MHARGATKTVRPHRLTTDVRPTDVSVHVEVDPQKRDTYEGEVTIELALDTAAAVRAERLLTATYRIDDHVDAIAHAAAAGRRGAVKIGFDLREGS